MNITVHPTATNKPDWAGLTDNAIITENGPGPSNHKTPKEILVLQMKRSSKSEFLSTIKPAEPVTENSGQSLLFLDKIGKMC